MPTFHVITSVQTGLSAEWYDNAKCVCCGMVIDSAIVETALDNGLAPCCPFCQIEVKEELANNFAVWPNNYHGNWSKGSSEPTWISEYNTTEGGE